MGLCLRINESAYLKLLDLSDVDELFVLTNRSRDTLREWLPFLDDVKTVTDTQQYADTMAYKRG